LEGTSERSVREVTVFGKVFFNLLREVIVFGKVFFNLLREVTVFDKVFFNLLREGNYTPLKSSG
jgi:hypothetical protein